MTTLLRFSGVSSKYGDAYAIQNVTFDMRRHTSMALLGRNGMGKTSTLRTLMRMKDPQITSGSIQFNGQSILGLDTYRLSELGIGYVPQGRHVFRSLTTHENLLVAESRGERGTERKWTIERVYEFFPALSERRRSLAGTLSGGEQQMLAIGRALMTNPILLVLDEPSEGLAPAIVDRVFHVLSELHADGLSVLLAEQDLHLATRLSEEFVVLKQGVSEFAGSKAEFLAQDALRNQLLGLGDG